MNTALTLLHMGSGPGFFFLPGLVASIFLTVALIKLVKHGRVGPVRWAPHRGGSDAPEAPRFGGHRPPWAQPSPEEAALATLAERLASGDITPEEYLERSSALRNARPEGSA